MSDITCAICGEPWDAYGVRNGDMEAREARLFLAGKGCPCCEFGKKQNYKMGLESSGNLAEEFLYGVLDNSE